MNKCENFIYHKRGVLHDIKDKQFYKSLAYNFTGKNFKDVES